MYDVCMTRARRKKGVAIWQPNRFAHKTTGYNNATIAVETGPLDVLRGKRVVVIADIENLSYSAKRLNSGYQISYKMLATLLKVTARSCMLHAFFSAFPGDRRREYFQARGWTSHVRPIECVADGRGGVKKFANADIAFAVGVGLLARNGFDAVVLATGDGELAHDTACAINALPKRREIFTLSLAGSTSRRLDARRNPYITGNIEVGLDVLKPINRNQYEGGGKWRC